MGQGDATDGDADTADAGTADAVAAGPDESGDGAGQSVATGDEGRPPSSDRSPETGDDSDSTYRGLLGTIPYAFRTSESRLFRSYVVVGGLVAVIVLVLFLVGVVSAFANTLGSVGGTFTFSRTFVFLAGAVVGIPVIAPIVLVARRHRLGGGSVAYDRALATAGFGYALSLYLALVISAPPDMREAPPAALAPVVEPLYALPPAAGLVPPLVAIGLLLLAHRRYRSPAGS